MTRKSDIRLSGVPIAAETFTWRLQTGSAPYISAISFDVKHAKRVAAMVGKEHVLTVIDGRNEREVFKNLVMLPQVASSRPQLVTYQLADRRWWWRYKLYVRDVNMTKRSGDRTLHSQNLPTALSGAVTTDSYDCRKVSLHEGVRKWTALELIEDILLTALGGKLYQTESFPLARDIPPVSLQFRDSCDVALTRALAYVPGADVYVAPDGRVRLFDSANLEAARAELKDLGPFTWDGGTVVEVDRAPIRPRTVRPHYTRVLEAVFEYSDNLTTGNTSQNLNPSEPWCINVIPTVDPITKAVTVYDSDGRPRTADVPAGTLVTFDSWLAAMQKIKPADSVDWTYDNLRYYWIDDRLDGPLGARGSSNTPRPEIALRLQALKASFRQLFQINPAYADRVQTFLDERVGVLETVRGRRAPSAVWGQACIVPSSGRAVLVPHRSDPEKAEYWTNIDFHTLTKTGNLIDFPVAPALVDMVDAERGVFRLDWKLDPNGSEGGIVPCHVVGKNEESKPRAPTSNTADQDKRAMGAGYYLAHMTAYLLLSRRLEFRVMISLVPAAPNSARRFHVEEIPYYAVDRLVSPGTRIDKGRGPALDVFVPPNEITARFAWENDAAAKQTLKEVLGLAGFETDPAKAGITARTLPGYTLTNGVREIAGHAEAMAYEHFVGYADALHGTAAVALGGQPLRIRGNISGVDVRVQGAPSGVVDAVYSFPGVAPAASRFGRLPAAARAIILGEVQLP